MQLKNKNLKITPCNSTTVFSLFSKSPQINAPPSSYYLTTTNSLPPSPYAHAITTYRHRTWHLKLSSLDAMYSSNESMSCLSSWAVFQVLFGEFLGVNIATDFLKLLCTCMSMLSGCLTECMSVCVYEDIYEYIYKCVHRCICVFIYNVYKLQRRIVTVFIWQIIVISLFLSIQSRFIDAYTNYAHPNISYYNTHPLSKLFTDYVFRSYTLYISYYHTPYCLLFRFI